jgi:hypothetical protein
MGFKFDKYERDPLERWGVPVMQHMFESLERRLAGVKCPVDVFLDISITPARNDSENEPSAA